MERGRPPEFEHATFQKGMIFELLVEKKEAIVREFTGLIQGKKDLIVPGDIISDQEKFKVVEIGESAFENCEIGKLMFDRKITISKFAKNCFASSQIKALEIPNSVTDIDPTAFRKCTQLSKFLVKSTNPNFVFENGLLLTRDRRELRFVAAGQTEVTIPPEVEVICGFAFSALTRCTVKIPEDTNLRELRADAFNGLILDDLVIPHTLEVIDPCAFRGMIGPKVINISKEPENPYFVEYLGILMNNLRTEIIIGETELAEISVPETVTKIRQYAFWHSNKLATLHFPPNSVCREIGEEAFSGCPLENISFPSSLMRIKKNAFSDCHELETFDFPRASMLTSFDDSVFSGSTLSRFSIPASLSRISTGTFENLEYLEKITVARANEKFVEDTGVLFSTDKKTLYLTQKAIEVVVVPKEVEVLGSWSCAKSYNMWQIKFDPSNTNIREFGSFSLAYTAIKNIQVPKSVTSIGDYVFMGTPLETVTFEPGSLLVKIGCGAFKHTKIKRVSIPSCIREISDEAFMLCRSLTGLDFGPNSNLTSIGQNAFHDTALTVIMVPSATQQIGRSAFESCPLENVFFQEPCKLAAVAIRCFANTKLVELKLPDSIEHIQSYAFAECTGLEKVEFAEGSKLKSIWPFAFRSTEIAQIEVPEECTFVSNKAFSECRKLSRFVVKSEKITISSDAFQNSENAIIYSDNVEAVKCTNTNIQIKKL